MTSRCNPRSGPQSCPQTDSYNHSMSSGFDRTPSLFATAVAAVSFPLTEQWNGPSKKPHSAPTLGQSLGSQNRGSPHVPATWTASPPEPPTPVGSRGGQKAEPEPPGGGRQQLAERLCAAVPSPGPPATHGFSLAGGPGAQRRRAGRPGDGATRRCGDPARPPGPRAPRKCPQRSATGRPAGRAGRPGCAS